MNTCASCCRPVAGALFELTPLWVTRKARAAIERSLVLIDDIAPRGPSCLEERDGLFFTTTCPMCFTPAGPRLRDEYLHPWPTACRVQTGNLLYETSLILWTITASMPAWATAATLRTLDMIRTALRAVATAMRLPECPQCGRWTTSVFGDPYGPKELQCCRWCLDAAGGMAIRLSVQVVDGRPVVAVQQHDRFGPARRARDLFPRD